MMVRTSLKDQCGQGFTMPSWFIFEKIDGRYQEAKKHRKRRKQQSTRTLSPFCTTDYMTMWPGLVLRRTMGQEARWAAAPGYEWRPITAFSARKNDTRVARLKCSKAVKISVGGGR